MRAAKIGPDLRFCGSEFFYLYNIRHIRKYLTSECTEKLIHAFITSSLDYCNSLLYGVPDHHMQNSNVSWMPVRDWSSVHLNTHITSLLQQLHWLPIRLRIEILILLITFKVLFYRHPVMIYSEITREFFWAPQSISQKLLWGIDPLWRQCHGFGTVFPKALDLLARKVMLNRNLTHFYSARHFAGTISLYLDFYIVFLQITFLITSCK